MSSSIPSTDSIWTVGLRLPTSVRPTRYDVALAPDLINWTFQGSIKIELNVSTQTKEIVCHSFELDYLKGKDGRPLAELYDASGVQLIQPVSGVELDVTSQRVRFLFDQPIPIGSYTLSVVFTGILNDQLAGFYRSAYTSARDGQPKFMAVTQFEATDCRRALPCQLNTCLSWDEPSVKAVFAVTLVVEPTQTSISNMPITRISTILQSPEEQRADPECRSLVVPKGWIRYRYADSPVMSSYLLAFIVGEFDYLSAFSNSSLGVPGARPVELRIYTPVGQTKQGEFALDVALKCLSLYETFFQLPYPLPKIDLIAVPDFASGAMENFGAITYRDTMLLIDPDNSSALIKQRCAKTIAHEMAHMWFGNLVTMEWWSTLWLNEGFARYCESWAIDVLFPDWQVMDQFINEVYGLAQSMDSLESSHPVELDVSTPEEINEIFDPINYNKGASLIRMLLQTIGDKVFQRGLQIYLHEFAYKNTTSIDLWNSMTRATAEQVKADGHGLALDIQLLMNQWVKEMGFPLLQVDEAPASGKQACSCFSISQHQFLQSGKPTADASSTSVVKATGGTTWHVPVAIGSYSINAVKTLSVAERILDKLSNVIELDQTNTDGKLIYSFNHQSTGFYRVLYSSTLFSSLSTLVSKQVLPPLDRLSLLRDCFSLSTCGQGYSISNLFDLILQFEHETNFTILQFLSIVLSNICNLHQDQPYYPQLQKLVMKIFGGRWKLLGWGPSPAQKVKEHHLTFLERAILLQMIGGYSGDASVKQHAYELLKAFVADPIKNAIQPDLRGPVYSLSIKHAGDEARQLLIQLYLSSTSSEEKVRVLSSLGTTRGLSTDDTAKEVNQLLDWVFQSGHVRNGDLIFAFTSIGLDSKLSRTLCWQYIKNHWDDLLARFKGAMFVLGRIFPAIIGEMSSVSEAEEFEAYFATHPAVGAERSVKQSSETVRMKSARLAREVPLIQQWIQQHPQ